MAATIDTSLNGLLSSALPSLFIRRIKLEQRGFTAQRKDKFGESLYIDQQSEINAGAAGVMGTTVPETYSSPNPEALYMTFDMVMKAPVVDDEIFEFLFDDDLLKYLYVNQAVFYGTEGKSKYMEALKMDSLELASWLAPWSGPPTEDSLNAASGPGYVRLEPIALSNVILGSSNAVSELGTDFFKKRLPDGTTIFEIPITAEANIDAATAANTPFLSTIAILGLGMNELKNDLNFTLEEAGLTTEGIGADVSMEELSYGALSEVYAESTSNWVGEIIIKDGALQKTGMMFTISQNQETQEHAKEFSQIKNQVWLGDVHVHEIIDSNGGIRKRYMAGSHHTPNLLHPYLDVHYVDNNKIQDFRQVARFNKLNFDFSSLDNMFFGGSYKQLGNRKTEPSLFRQVRENMSLFSPLLSSVTKEEEDNKRIDLFFGLDVGKMLKKNCVIPSLIDKAAFTSAQQINAFISTAKPISLEIHRKRIDIPDVQVDTTSNKKLIYFSEFPLAVNYDATDAEGIGPSTTLETISEGSLFLSDTESNNFHTYFTLSDREQFDDGIYEYSVVINYTDPAIDYLKEVHQIVYTALNGTGGLNNLVGRVLMGDSFDSYTGMFKKSFIKEAENYYGKLTLLLNPVYVNIILGLLKGPKSQEEISTEDFIQTVATMLDVHSATPDSIIAVTNMVKKIETDLTRLIESFSIQKIPKTEQINPGYSENYEGNVYNTSATISRTFSVEHTFRETINTIDKNAGYDFLSDLGPSRQVGLKEFTINDYRYGRIDAELSKMFAKNSQGNYNSAFAITMKGANDDRTILQNTTTSAYSYLTLPAGGALLPQKYKKNLIEDNFINLIFSIMSYKKDVPAAFGTSGAEPIFLGIDAGLESDKVKNHIELMAKKNLILAEMGVKIISPEDIKEKAVSGVSKLNDLSGLPISSKSSPESFETKTEEVFTYNQEVPNLDLDIIASSLLNLSSLSLKLKDYLLSAYDSSNPNSAINQKFWSGKTGWNADEDQIKRLPNPIKALMIANNESMQPILNTEVVYPGGTGPKMFGDTKVLFLKQFGNYWFRHQNIVEVQYLSSFEGVQYSDGGNLIRVSVENPNTGKEEWQWKEASLYEERYNSAISAPIWQRLTLSALTTAKSQGKTLLCRLIKYNNPLVKGAKEMMDLPLYGEHFLLTAGVQGAMAF